jgi:FkbM family methyltransferase
LRKFIKSLLPGDIKRNVQQLLLGYKHYYPSFSSSGEDMILNYLFTKKLLRREPGFYVDIGAYQPVKFSATYFFYYNNWRGINIDATPGSMEAFKQLRPRDINLEIGVAENTGHLTFYNYPDNDTINTFNPAMLELEGGVKLKVKTLPLATIMEQHLPKGQLIDFISIDVEGFELEVLKSNDWEKYRPFIVLIEYFEMDFNKIFSSDIYRLMTEKGYKLILRTPIGLYFAEKDVEFDKNSNKINI